MIKPEPLYPAPITTVFGLSITINPYLCYIRLIARLTVLRNMLYCSYNS